MSKTLDAGQQAVADAMDAAKAKASAGPKSRVVRVSVIKAMAKPIIANILACQIGELPGVLADFEQQLDAILKTAE